MHFRGVRVMLALASAIFVVLTISTPSSLADNGSDKRADGRDHYFCFDTSVPSGERQMLRDSMAYLDDVSVMYDVQTANSGATCGTSTDVMFFFQDLGNSGERGYAPCWRYVANSSTVCDQFLVIVDQPEIASQSALHYPYGSTSFNNNYAVNLMKTARHEIGHSAGLAHTGSDRGYLSSYVTSNPDVQDSMVSGWVPTNLLWLTYSHHHLTGPGHISDLYP